jgi:hypothetical protein
VSKSVASVELVGYGRISLLVIGGVCLEVAMLGLFASTGHKKAFVGFVFLANFTMELYLFYYSLYSFIYFNICIITVRGWATWSSDGHTHAGYILNPGKSMRAYTVPGQRITLLFKTVLLSRSRRGE